MIVGVSVKMNRALILRAVQLLAVMAWAGSAIPDLDYVLSGQRTCGGPNATC